MNVILTIKGHDREVNFNACINMMDDDLREKVHCELTPCTDQAFLDRYCQLHEKKYGEEFQI